jgi:hypothetical protein
MGGNNRDMYFDKHIRNTKTANAYLMALKSSPYRTHRRMGFALEKQFPTVRSVENFVNEQGFKKEQHENPK